MTIEAFISKVSVIYGANTARAMAEVIASEHFNTDSIFKMVSDWNYIRKHYGQGE